jgi:feruloyl esterase
MTRFTLGAAAAIFTLLSAIHSAKAEPVCSVETLPFLPDVRIASVSRENAMAPHCKVAGVVGTETNFELLLPEKWNGKFLMGGGGGFVGSIINTAIAHGALQSGYATLP